MHSKPTKKEKIQLAVMIAYLAVIPIATFIEPHQETDVFNHPIFSILFIGTGILLVRWVMLDHPFLLHPWDEPYEDDEEDETDDESLKD